MLRDLYLNTTLNSVLDIGCMKSSVDLYDSFKKGWEIIEEILAKEIDSKFQHQLTPPLL